MASTQDVPPRGGSMPVSPHATAPSPSLPPPPAGTIPHAGDDNNRGRAMLVGAILAGLVLSAAVMVGFIWYRWYGVDEPTTAVIVTADATLDGTLVTVTGGPRTERVTLGLHNGYRADVLVVPGRYTVTAERDGRRLLRREVEVRRHLAIVFDLKLIAEELGQSQGVGPGETGPGNP